MWEVLKYLSQKVTDPTDDTFLSLQKIWTTQKASYNGCISSSTPNNLKHTVLLKILQMSFSWWMDKLWYNGPIDNGILFSNKQKWDTKPRKERGTLNGYYGAREANLKRLYGTEFQLRDCGKRKMGDNKKTSGCQRFAGRKEWVEQGISGEVKTVFCDTLQLWLLMSLYMLSKPTECTAQKPEP